MGSALGSAGLVAAVAAFGLAFFPPLVLIALFLLGPAGAAFLFAGRPVSIDTFVANGIGASIVSGLTGAAWLAVNADDGDAAAAIAVGAFVSFLILSFLGEAGCFLAAKVLTRRRAAAAEPEPDIED